MATEELNGIPFDTVLELCEKRDVVPLSNGYVRGLIALIRAKDARIAELEAQVTQAAQLQVEMSDADPLYPLRLLAYDERHQRNINAFLDGVQP